MAETIKKLCITTAQKYNEMKRFSQLQDDVIYVVKAEDVAPMVETVNKVANFGVTELGIRKEDADFIEADVSLPALIKDMVSDHLRKIIDDYSGPSRITLPINDGVYDISIPNISVSSDKTVLKLIQYSNDQIGAGKLIKEVGYNRITLPDNIDFSKEFQIVISVLGAGNICTVIMVPYDQYFENHIDADIKPNFGGNDEYINSESERYSRLLGSGMSNLIVNDNTSYVDNKIPAVFITGEPQRSEYGNSEKPVFIHKAENKYVDEYKGTWRDIPADDIEVVNKYRNYYKFALDKDGYFKDFLTPMVEKINELNKSLTSNDVFNYRKGYIDGSFVDETNIPDEKSIVTIETSGDMFDFNSASQKANVKVVDMSKHSDLMLNNISESFYNVFPNVNIVVLNQEKLQQYQTMWLEHGFIALDETMTNIVAGHSYINDETVSISLDYAKTTLGLDIQIDNIKTILGK